MKILAIRGRNLASLAGEFEVDFEQEPLRSTGLFAISGPTGAGKSTLLDALCMALYERTPRLLKAGQQTLPDVGEHTVTQQDARNLLRRGCAEGHAEVDFVGSDGVRYRARWSVRRARGKADGSLQKTTMSLHQLPGLQPLGGTNREVLAEITQRIGLSFEQFTRAVLLAQNEFSSFLKADDSERGALLETLTGSSLYSDLSQRAYARAAQERQAKEQIEARFADHKPLDADARTQLDRDHQAAQAHLAALEAQDNTLQAQWRWFTDDARLQAGMAEAEAALQGQQATHDAAAERRAQLQQLESVQAARPLLAEAQRLHAAVTQARQQLAQSDAARAQAEVQHQNLLQQRQEAQTLLQQQEQAQADAHPDLAAARDLDSRIATLVPVHQTLTQAQAQAQAAAQQAQQQRAAQQSALQQAQARQEAIATWLAGHTRVQALAEQWSRWDLLLQQAQGLRDEAAHHASEHARLDAEQHRHQQHLTTAQQSLTEAQARHADALTRHQQALARHAAIDIQDLQRSKAAETSRREQLRDALQLATTQQAQQQRLGELAAQLQAHQQTERQALAAAEQAGTRLPALQAALDQAERSLKMAEAACGDTAQALRASLQDDAPCPVCGATTHPYAEQSPQLHALLERLQAEVQQRRDEVQQCQQQHTRHSTEARTHRQHIDALEQQTAPLRSTVAQHAAAWLAHPLCGQLPGIDLIGLSAIDMEALRGQLANALAQSDAEFQALAEAEDHWRATLADLQAAQLQLDQQGQAHNAAKDAVNAAQATLLQVQARCQAASSQQLQCERQLGTRLAELAPAFPPAQDSPVLSPPWQATWRADPAAFHAQCSRKAQQWQAQQAARDDIRQTLATLAQEGLSAQQLCDSALAAQQHADTALADSEAHLQALRADRQALLGGQPAEQVEAALRQAVAVARHQSDLCQQQHDDSQQAMARATEALAQAQARLGTLVDEHMAAQQALVGWLQAHHQAPTGTVPATDLDLPALVQLLAHPAGWLVTEREALQQLADTLQQARTVLAERQRQHARHQASRPVLDVDDAAAETPDAPPTQASADSLQQALARIATAREAAQTQLTALQLALAMDQDRRAQSAGLLVSLAAQEARWRVWAQLNELIGAADGKKFRNYAQQLTLDVLLGYANRHLHELSRRYRLQRIPDTLALMVIDQDMGDEQRSVHSLSGGESFLVSLALALGLASLSSNRVRVESLFIDEGFGSLDADTLRIAMDALDGLQSLGRKVGVISHVQEMTERIATQVCVQRAAGGRSVVVVR